MLERLQKIIARAGVASRRAAERLIVEGRVRVNGKVVTELGSKADPDRDAVKVDSRLITRPGATKAAERYIYIMFHKPRNVVTTLRDPQKRPCLAEYLRRMRVDARVYPVGRLDFASEGLLILTNDGDLTYALTHPKHGVEKTYHVKVRNVPIEGVLRRMERGVTVDGERLRAASAKVLRAPSKNTPEGFAPSVKGRKPLRAGAWLEIVLREGKSRHIRRMTESLGHPVQKLRRVALGPLRLGDMPAGAMRPLTREEVAALRRVATTTTPRKVSYPSSSRRRVAERREEE